MKAAILAMGMAGLLVGQAWGQVAEGVQAQIQEIGAQLAALRQAAMESPEVEAKRQAMVQTEMACEAAMTNIPAVRAIDAQMAQLRVTMRELMQQRQAALQANAAQLESLDKARTEAANAYWIASMGGQRGLVLLQRRGELQRSILARTTEEPVAAEMRVPVQ